MSGEILTVKIDRATWRWGGDARTHEHGKTHLLNILGERCCLGFIANAMGCTDEQIRHKEGPSDLGIPLGRLTTTFQGKHLGSELSRNAIRINDSNWLSRDERERHLIELFTPEGIHLEFVGEYPQ